MQRIHQEQDLDVLRRATQAGFVIAAWSSAGLFQALSDGKPRAVHELPAHARAIELTAPVLVHLGLLALDGERGYALTRTAQALLASGALTGFSPGGLAEFAQLDRVMRDGAPIRATEGGVVADDREATRGFMEMLHRRSADSAEEVARWVAPRLKGGAHVLDLGGGHGRYAHTLVTHGLRATLFDVPVCIELARERHGEALAYRAGDFMQDDLGGPYDAVLLSNIVHGLGASEVRKLLARTRGALAPRGLLVVKDMLLDDHGADPEEAAFFSLLMLLYTRGGKSHGLGELRALCREAGLSPEDHVYVPDQRFSLLLARAD